MMRLEARSLPARSLLLAAAGVYAGVCLWLTGCREPVERPGFSELTVMYTADTQGHIEPCGCASGQAGGISRRMTYISNNASEFALLVDAGDVTAGPRDWEFFELSYILKGYAAMGYDAVNAGHREASIDAARLRQLAGEHDFIVSANLLDEAGKTIFPPYRIVTFPGERRVGILGVMDETLAPGSIAEDVQVSPAMDAVAAYLPKLAKETDFVVVLAFANEDTMRALAERFYEIDLIVGGDVMQPTRTPIQANRSLIVTMTDKGKAIGQLDLKFADARITSYENEIHMLYDTMIEDPDIAKIVTEFKNKLEDMDFQPHRDDEEGLTTITAARSATANRFVSAQDCAQCHPQAVRTWKASKHSHAYKSLVSRGHGFNPRCLQCHTVGYGASDGFLSKEATPALAAVSCANCHGRGDYHIKQHRGEMVPGKVFPLKSQNCTTCHDPENSPDFDFDAYWKLIKHGLD